MKAKRVPHPYPLTALRATSKPVEPPTALEAGVYGRHVWDRRGRPAPLAARPVSRPVLDARATGFLWGVIFTAALFVLGIWWLR